MPYYHNDSHRKYNQPSRNGQKRHQGGGGNNRKVRQDIPLTSPYNFAPIERRVYIPSWGNMVSHDIPFKDGEDGYLDIEVTNESPLFVRDGHSKNQKTNYSSHIMDENGRRIYFIPATTLKGMLRQTMEVLAFAKMSDNQYNDCFFGYRKFDSHETGYRDYIDSMAEVKSGWMEKNGDEYVIFPCKRQFKAIPISEIENHFTNYKKGKSAWTNNQNLGIYPEMRYEGHTWKVVCSGSMRSKKHEYLFDVETKDEGLVLTEREQMKFLTVNEPNREFSKFRDYLEKRRGNSIAVFYIENNEDDIVAIGISKMIRYPYRKSISDILNKQQEQISPAKRDLCEAIWGTTKEESLRGRVQISHAFCNQTIPDQQLIFKSGVLGGPKASYYPLYLEQTGKEYKTYDNAQAISGRKRYRIHSTECTYDLPDGNDNDNTKTQFKAIPSGMTFRFRINIHNLKAVEIGAVLSALTFHNTPGTHHCLGQAKSFGFGKLSTPSIQLYGLSHDMTFYLRAFEDEMKRFYGNGWNHSRQITMLIAIAKEHNEEELRFMSLDGYKTNKKNDYFKTLEESIQPVRNI